MENLREKKQEKIDGKFYDMSPAADYRHSLVNGNIFYRLRGQFQDSLCAIFMENLDLFLEAVDLGIEVMIMEISSHAIHESRIGFIRFDRMVYTNVAFEHLDYHQTFAHYRYTKFKARHYLKKEGWIVMNYDCEWLQELIYLFQA